MKTENLVSRTWDDLVFEKRNREYGAYLIRKDYTNNMTAGLGISVALACLVLILPNVLNMLSGGHSVLPKLPLPKDPTIVLDDFQIPITKLPPPPSHAPQVKIVNNLPPQVVTHASDEVIATVEDLATSQLGTENITGDIVTDIPVTAAVVEPPAPDENTIRSFAEVMPQYEGGTQEMMRFISRRVRYPHSAERMQVEGTVFVSFVIDREGKVTDVNVVKGISTDCDREAIRVISMMKLWTPGMQNHRAVSVRMMLPIKFQLNQ